VNIHDEQGEFEQEGMMPGDGAPRTADEQRIAILNALGMSLAAKRREAVSARAASGIETEWTGDEEFYQGYDDANRHEFVNSATKPRETGGSNAAPPQKDGGSTVFPNITQPYADAAAARVGDMLLPTDDRNFAVDPTPIPNMFEGLDAEIEAAPAMPEPAPQPMPGVPVPPEAPAQPEPQVQMPDGSVMALSEAKAKFEKVKQEAKRKADKAQEHIDDNLSECQYHAEMRKVIDDCAKLGTGVMKGPVPVLRKSRQWRKDEKAGVYALIMVEEIKPASFRVDPWNIFPADGCGESIHNGSYIWERDHFTSKVLEGFKKLPGYIESQIDLCLEEGPKSGAEADSRSNLQSNNSKDQFEGWHFHGTITGEELRAAGCDFDGEEDDDTKRDNDKKSFPVMVTMVNDRVIRASLNPLDSGEFPYDLIPWKRRPGMPWGMGVARQMRTPQRIVVAATRNLMDNAGQAAGPQIIIGRGVEPVNNKYEIRPLKLWEAGDDADGNGKLLDAVVIPMLQVELMNIVQFGMKMAEDVTGLPMLLQGQQGKAPDTVGGMTILNNNANAVLRRFARLFDSCITEPHIRRYYSWLMEYGEDDDAKGDFQIVARGSSALVERDIQAQEIIQVLGLSLNPAYKLDPAKAVREYLKSRRFNTANFEYTEEELKKMANQTPPEDPRITAAKIMAGARSDELDKKLSADAQKTQAQHEVDITEAAKDRALEQWLKSIDAELAGKELTADERKSLEEAKVTLSGLAMKLNVQKDLSLAGHTADLYKHKTSQVVAPAAEPVGRAAEGQAFAQ
jgi:hypothetical protein